MNRVNIFKTFDNIPKCPKNKHTVSSKSERSV